MKRLFVVIGSLLVLPAFAEVVPQVVYDDGIELVDDAVAVEETTPDQVQQPKQTIQSVRAGGRSANSSRLTAARTNATSPRSKSVGRSVSARNTIPAATKTDSTRSNTIARTSVASDANVMTRPTSNTTNNATVNTTRASILRGGTSLYNANNTARVSTRNSAVSFSGTSATTSSVSTAANTTDELDKLAETTDYCKAQYAMCMDNYCDVLDDNQGRCSCSANLSNYEKTEVALTTATEALQDVAQQIQYIGLSAKDIETIFNETEAEAALSKDSDTTTLKSDLDKIKRMIVDVKSGTASSSVASANGISFDSGLFNFSFDSTGFDFTSFMNTTNSTNTSSISNQRGANLYKTATARCKASVLNSCVAQGVDASIITNAYDLQIDKACLAYERNLKDANTEMNSTVRNAKSVLQKARLMVAQNKNAYDLRGCVEALDSCMQSDFVCGTDYENCLDSTGKYIVNGEVVLGSEPGTDTSTSGLYTDAWTYDTSKNAWTTGDLASYIDKTSYKGANATDYPTSTDKTMSKFLQFKIGYFDNDKKTNNGMCISVLNQCQNYTYDTDNNYKPNNAVIQEYLRRTLTQIKASQDNILAEYAENCLADVESCLSTNNYDRSANVAINACRAQIKTCMSVNGTPGETTSLQSWVDQNIMTQSNNED